MRRPFQVSVAYLAASRGSEWKSKSFNVKALNLEGAERAGLKLLGRQISVSKLWDYAVCARSLDSKTERSIQ
jgi:hypothetical protein